MKVKFLVAGAICVSQFAFAAPTTEMQKILDAIKSQGGKPIETLTVDEARMQPTISDAIRKMPQRQEEQAKSAELAVVKDMEIDGAEGKIKARMYKPSGNEPMPVVMYYHGGGFVLSDIDDYDATPRSLSDKTGAIWISVEYRKAPEHKFPAAHNDAYAAYLWALKNVQTFGGDPKRIAVAGESAGGNLAMNVSIRARDEGTQLPIHQLIIYPVAGTDRQTASYVENKDAEPLNAARMDWFMKQYLRNTEDLKDKRINLLTADLKGLPSTTLITAEIDPLRSEGEKLSQELMKNGVPVVYRDYRGVTHEFFGMGSVLTEARQAQDEVASNMKTSFTQPRKM